MPLKREVEDLAASEPLVVRPSNDHKCPGCFKTLSFTVRELKGAAVNGTTGGFRKTCTQCREPLFVLLWQGDIEGVASIEIIDVQRYPAA
jgi:hypothetical protein